MTVHDLINSGLFEPVNAGADLQRQLTVPFCCDLLSVALGRAPSGCAWVTVIGSINVLAVAVLTKAACVILAEGSILDENSKKKAKEQGITVLKTDMPVFQAALLVYQCMQIQT